MQHTCKGLWLILPCLIAAGCGVGNIGDSAAGTEVRLDNGDSGLFQETSGDGSNQTTISTECLQQTLQASTAPVRRLTAQEYLNTVQDLFGGMAVPELDLPTDVRSDGFENGVLGQSASPLTVEQYRAAAKAVAAEVVSDIQSWAPCTDETEACAQQVLQWVATRAFRRPLSESERVALEDFSVEAMSLDAPTEAITMGIEGLLQSPSFLYRTEFGTNSEVEDGVVTLSGYELASRLSYFFTGSMPDAELLAAAANGDLSTLEGYKAQAERLLNAPRAREVLTDFFMEWLGLHKLEDLALDADAFPEFSDQLRKDLQASARKYIDYALWEEDSWVALMTGSYGFVNDRLAPYFGVDAPGSGEELVYVELNSNQRRGVLTQPATLASTSHGSRHSPILRGVMLLTNVFCMAPAPPPPDAFVTQVEDVDESQICTTRDDVFMKHTSSGGCQTCHKQIDAAGFNFENYDALGMFRTQENGCAVDATGTVLGADISSELPDAVSMADEISASEDATTCFAEHVYRFALGRTPENGSSCEVQAIAEPLLAGEDSLQKMLINMAMSPSFLSRPAAQ